MWTVTDKDGNRLLQTQDGGQTYGYIITGDLNTAEYELLVENGKDGKDGKAMNGYSAILPGMWHLLRQPPRRWMTMCRLLA